MADQKKQVCMYFQVHQPYRLRRYKVFDIGKSHDYFDEDLNKKIIKKVSEKCYLPANNLLLNLIKKHHGKIRLAFSITGVAIEQLKKYYPEALDSFIKLIMTGCVELLSETYYHSLAFIYSKNEFIKQVEMHKKLIKEVFGQAPKVFRNTELIYNDELAELVKNMGYKAIITEGADHILKEKSPNYVYSAINSMKLLLKNYRLSDDIAFRFSDKNWIHYPLTADKFASWVKESNGNIINLFMDYETFGEHQWQDTGIFEFFEKFFEFSLKSNIGFSTPSQIIKNKSYGKISIKEFISWADIERDLSAWAGNRMQKTALSEIYKIEAAVKKTNDKNIIEDWRKLQTSDHFYYMCTKYFNDGDVHKYFNPYDTPYDSYIYFMNILNDLAKRINKNLNLKICEHPSILLKSEKKPPKK